MSSTSPVVERASSTRLGAPPSSKRASRTSAARVLSAPGSSKPPPSRTPKAPAPTTAATTTNRALPARTSRGRRTVERASRVSIVVSGLVGLRGRGRGGGPGGDDGEAEHHPGLVVLGDVAVRHPPAGVADVEEDVDGLAGADQHGVL